MSQDQGNPQLEKLLALSTAMLTHARQDDWDEVFRLEDERREIMTGVFSGAVSAASSERLAKIIQSILDQDQEVCRLATKLRDELRGELEKISRGKGAVDAYSTA